VSRSLLSVYGRPDAYYLVPHAQTTSGVWLLDGSPAVVVAVDASPEDLGRAVSRAIAQDGPRVPHPSQQEWTSSQKERRAALFQQAGVRSWRSFERGSALVSVEREGETTTVTPLRRDNARPDAWSDDTQRAVHLEAPGEVALGRAVIEVLDSSRS